MKKIVQIGVAWLLVVSCGVTAANTNTIDRLILKLGASTYQDRKDAMDALWETGLPAQKALEQAATSRDPEVSMNARRVLNDIQNGIRPSWPEALRRQVRDYEAMTTQGKHELINRLVETLGTSSIPFLLRRIEKGDSDDAGVAIEKLQQMEADDDNLWGEIIESMTEPQNTYQSRLLALACLKSGTIADRVRILKSRHLDDSLKSQLVNISLKHLQEELDQGQFTQVAEHAAMLAEAVDTEARFIYLQAIAARKRNQNDVAHELATAALALNPEDESPHYVCGELLGELGRSDLAEKEWLRILEIPPQGDVYDINAHLRLGSIRSADHRHAESAKSFETALSLYQAARATGGSGYGIVGSDTNGLAKMVEKQRKAATECSMSWSSADGLQGDLFIDAHLDITVRNGNLADMKQALSKAAMAMVLGVQPHGIRLFRDAKAHLNYDTVKQEFNILLNSSPCSKPYPYKLTEEETNVAVETLDMCYIYTVRRETGETVLAATYEKDFVLKIVPSTSLESWGQPTITLNGKTTTWEKLEQGIPFDFLPESLELRVEGIDPKGERQEFQRTLDPAELEEPSQLAP